MPPDSAESIHGWMSPGELRWLQETASRMSSVAEIGCWRGRSTFALLSGCLGPVYAIDRASITNMDRTCQNCGHVTHDGIGKCRFCGTPFPESAEGDEAAGTTGEIPQADGSQPGNGRRKKAN